VPVTLPTVGTICHSPDALSPSITASLIPKTLTFDLLTSSCCNQSED